MPTYEYVCTNCHTRIEVVQSFSDDPLTVCDDCRGTLRKVFSPVGVVFKGSGFYRTDSRSESGSGKGRAAASPDSEATPAKKGPGAGSTDTTPTPQKTADASSTPAATPAGTSTGDAGSASGGSGRPGGAKAAR